MRPTTASAYAAGRSCWPISGRPRKSGNKPARTPNVETFGNLAEEYSVEASSKALQGKVPPIQRHGGQPLLEKEAFSLQARRNVEHCAVGRQVRDLLLRGSTPSRRSVSFNEVKQDIYNDIHEKKQRIAMAEVFNQLKESAQIDNFLAGNTQSPNKRASHSAAAPPSAAPTGPKRNPAPATANKPAPRLPADRPNWVRDLHGFFTTSFARPTRSS